MKQVRVGTKVNPSNLHTKSVKNGKQFEYERKLNGVYSESEFRELCPGAFCVEIVEVGPRSIIRGGGATVGEGALVPTSPEQEEQEEPTEAKEQEEPGQWSVCDAATPLQRALRLWD